ncbi:MAG: hypothetical protein AAGD01_09550 [Acidobacteriota bacterium]
MLSSNSSLRSAADSSSSSPRSARWLLALVLLVALPFLAGGCNEILGKKDVPPGSALWLPEAPPPDRPLAVADELLASLDDEGAESDGAPAGQGEAAGEGEEGEAELVEEELRRPGELLPGDLLELEGVDIQELFVEAAQLRWDEGKPTFEPQPLWDLPARSAVVLVVRGPWRPEGDGGGAGQALAARLQRLAGRAEGGGLRVVGFHLDVAAGRDLETFATAVEEVAATLTGGRLLSVSIQRAWLEDPELERLAAAVDYYVAWLYGERPGRLADPEAWKLSTFDSSLDQLEALGTPYKVGVVTLGTALHLSASGERLGITHQGRLADLALDRAFELQPNFEVLGVDARRYDFEARGTARFGRWRVGPRQRIQVQSTSSHYLRELRRRAAARELSGYLGEVFYRLPQQGEGLGPSLDALLDALGPSPQVPPLEVELRAVRQDRNSVILRVALRNPGYRSSELVYLEGNYLQLEVSGGSIWDASQGDFYRYAILLRDRSGSTRATLRDAKLLQLYMPVLEPGAEVVSGPIEIRRQGDVRVEVEASFLLPEGEPLVLPPTSWAPD